MLRTRLLVGTVLAAAALAVLVADPAKPLPRSQLVRTRDCLHRPNVCVNGAGGLELVYPVMSPIPARPVIATVLNDRNCDRIATGSRTA